MKIPGGIFAILWFSFLAYFQFENKFGLQLYRLGRFRAVLGRKSSEVDFVFGQIVFFTNFYPNCIFKIICICKVTKFRKISPLTISQAGLNDALLSPTLQDLHGYFSNSH